MRLIPFGILVLLLIVSQTGLSASVVKVMRGNETVILKLNKKEKERISAGDQVVIRNNGETIDATVEDISGMKAKVKIDFGIDKLAEGDTVRFGSPNSEMRSGKKFAKGDTGNDSGPVFGGFGKGNAPRTPYGRDLDFPFLFDMHLTNDVPGTAYSGAHLTRIEEKGGAVFVRKGDYKLTSKFDTSKTVIDGDETSFGLSPIAMTVGDARLGLGVSKQEIAFKATIKPDSGGSSKIKGSTEVQTISLLGSFSLSNRVTVGIKFNSVDWKDTVDASDLGLDKDSESESFTETQVSVLYHEPDYEVAVNYAPPIHIEEDVVSIARPVTWNVYYRKTLASGSHLIVNGEHRIYSAFSAEEKNRPGILIGSLFGTGFGTFGGYLHYAHKYYSEKEDVDASNIGIYGLMLSARYDTDRTSFVGFTFDFANGDDKGKDAADEDVKLSSRGVVAQLSYGKSM